MYEFLATRESLDKIVENVVNGLISDHNNETYMILSRFGHTLTYHQADVYKTERNRDLVEKVRNFIHTTIGHITPNYSIEHDSWTELDPKTMSDYRCYKISVLNPENMRIVSYGFKERINYR